MGGDNVNGEEMEQMELSKYKDGSLPVTEPSYRDVCCHPSYSRATFIGMVMQAFTQLSGINVVLMFSSTILASIGSARLVNGLVGGVNFACTIFAVFVIKYKYHQ